MTFIIPPSFLKQNKKKKSKLYMRHQNSYSCRSSAQMLLCSKGQCGWVRAVPRQWEHKLPPGEQSVSSGRLLSSEAHDMSILLYCWINVFPNEFWLYHINLHEFWQFLGFCVRCIITHLMTDIRLCIKYTLSELVPYEERGKKKNHRLLWIRNQISWVLYLYTFIFLSSWLQIVYSVSDNQDR